MVRRSARIKSKQLVLVLQTCLKPDAVEGNKDDLRNAMEDVLPQEEGTAVHEPTAGAHGNNASCSRKGALQNPVKMVRRSARVKANQLMLEGEHGTVKVTEDVSPQVVADANEPNAGSQTARERVLQNPVILQHLFQLCPSRIVATCRLVCKQWYEESLAIWRTTFPFCVVSQNKAIVLGRLCYFNSSIRPPLKDFLEFIEKPENQCSTKPYRCMKLSSAKYNSTQGCNLNYQGLTVLWKAIGSNLTTLNLSGCKFSSAQDFREIIFKCCPILQKLSVNCEFSGAQTASGIKDKNGVEYREPLYGEHKFLRYLEITVGIETLPVSWIELLSHFPWLTTLKVISIFRQAESEFEILIEAIKVIRKRDANKLPLKRFGIQDLDYPYLTISQDPESHRLFALVKELRLPLTNCIIEIEPGLDQRFLRNTLDYLASSVNSIKIFAGHVDNEADQLPVPKWFRDFPFGIQMNNLTSLIFEGDICGSLTFLKYTPNLEVLDISQDEEAPPVEVVACTSTTGAVVNTCKEELANLKMVRLTTLRLEYIVSNDDMRHLINWMPDIMDLEMVLNDEQFNMVCQNWKNLRSLKVLGRGLLTEGVVTGLEKGKKAMEVGIHPNISKLEVLESLVLNNQLTPESVFHLLLHVGSLQELRYGGIPFVTARVRVQRQDLDLSAYQRAIQDDLVEQWIADNGNNLGVYEDEESDSD